MAISFQIYFCSGMYVLLYVVHTHNTQTFNQAYLPPCCILLGQLGGLHVKVNLNTHMPICSLEEVLVTVIVPAVHNGHEEIHSQGYFNDGGHIPSSIEGCIGTWLACKTPSPLKWTRMQLAVLTKALVTKWNDMLSYHIRVGWIAQHTFGHAVHYNRYVTLLQYCYALEKTDCFDSFWVHIHILVRGHKKLWM